MKTILYSKGMLWFISIIFLAAITGKVTNDLESVKGYSTIPSQQPSSTSFIPKNMAILESDTSPDLSYSINGGNEEFRKKLIAYFDELQQIYPYIKKYAYPDILDKVSRAKKDVQGLSSIELAQVEEVFARNPALFDTPQQLLKLLQQTEASQSPRNALAPANCPAGLPGGISDLYIAKNIAQGEEFALAFAPQDEVFGAIVLGEGVVSTIWAHPAKLVLEAFYEATKVTVLGLETAYAINDSCLQEYYQAFLVEHNNSLTQHDTHLTQHDAHLTQHDTHLTQHDTNTTNLITQVQNTLDEHNDNLLAHDARLTEHDNRLMEHEAQLAEHDSRLMAHDAHLTEHDNRLAEHDARLAAHDLRLAEHDARITDLIGDMQFTLENNVELRRVHLQVIEIREKTTFLVGASEGGIPLDGVEFTSIKISSNQPDAFTDVTAQTTITMIEKGIYLVEINLPKDVENAGIYAFEVTHAHDAVKHYGFTIFHRNSQNNLGTGQ